MRGPKFVMTPSGRILTRADYEREQRFAADYARQQQMERSNQEWLAAIAESVSESDEPPMCQCGKHYLSASKEV
jgi:hypothetical protein